MIFNDVSVISPLTIALRPLALPSYPIPTS